MKFVFMTENESWFWMLDETGCIWECWFEEGDTPATRAPKMDRPLITDVTEMIAELGKAMLAEINK